MKTLDLTRDTHFSSKQLQEAFDRIAKDLKKFATSLSKIDESITVPVNGDLEQQLAELTKRFDAARRGLALVNKLSPGAQKTVNARRVMGNLNTIRAKLSRVSAAMNDFLRAEGGYEGGSDLEAPSAMAAAGSESEEESSPRGWALNTLDSIMSSASGQKDDGEFCKQCFCSPCECGQEENEEYCPDCDGYEHTAGVHPDMAKAAKDSEELKNWNLKNPFEQEEESGCPDCGKDPCECRFGELKQAVRRSQAMKDWNLKNPFEQEEEQVDHNVCPECKEEPCECCNFCKKSNCTC